MTDDIKEIYDEIKNKVNRYLISNDDKLLKEIIALYSKLFELLKIFLISMRDIYYGYFFINLVFKAKISDDLVAGISLERMPLEFYYNPLRLVNFEIKELLYIMCHEIDHIVFEHPKIMVQQNINHNHELSFKFNMAADASINDRINKEIVEEKHTFLKQPNGIITSRVLAKEFNLKNVKKCQSYAYYFNLIKDLDNHHNSKNGYERCLYEKTLSDDNYKIDDHNWECFDEEEVTETIKEFLNETYGQMSDDVRGNLPAFLIETIKRNNELAKISWQKVLKKYVGSINSGRIKTRSRLNRRQPKRFDLSGTMPDKSFKIVVGLDTSGSVSNEMISKFINEILAIVAKRKNEITIIECDSEINKIYKVKSSNDIDYKISGRGGTSFIPVIDYVNNHKEYRDALLIYFTDGFGDDDIPKPLTYKNIWVVIGDKENLSLKEPYGIVLELN